MRRYTKDWKAPDDRKVNPWDLNEQDPTDGGTMGTIPGPTIECNVGDTVRMHSKVLAKTERGRGRFGVITWHRQIINQHGKVVQEGTTETLVEGRANLERAAKTSDD